MANKIKAPPNETRVPDGIRNEIELLTQQQLQVKISIADKWLELRQAERALEALQAKQEAVLYQYAKPLGIDLKNPAKGRWVYQIDSGLLKRVE